MKHEPGNPQAPDPKAGQLTTFDIAMIVVSLVIGMGIFRTPVNVARHAASGEMFFLAWAFGGIVALCGAFTFAEIGSRYPVTGGYYKIFSYCYHSSIAFSINCITLISNAAALAGVALIGSEYFTNLVFGGSRDTGTIKLVISAIAIVVFYAMNLLGLKTSVYVQNILTVIKIGMVVVLTGALFTGNTDQSLQQHMALAEQTGWASYLKTLGAALVAVSFTYGGYQSAINFGGETNNARRVLPRGIFTGMAIVMVLYLAINYTYYRVIGLAGLREAESIGAILAGSVFGDKGYAVFSVLLFLCVLGYVNASLMNNPRVMFAMSEDGALPAIFKKRNPRTNVMVISLTAFTALCMLTLFYAKTFDEILNHVIIFESIGMASAAATIFILRKRTADLDTKKIFTMRLYPFTPLLFIAVYLLVGVSIVVNNPATAGISLLVFLIFFCLYFFLRKKNTL